MLTRAIRTANLALEAADQLWIPMIKDWRLNERHYGALTGREHGPTEAEYGLEQVKIWRRSYDVLPPPMAPGGEYDFAKDRRYAGMTPPTAESLKTTLDRVLPYWNSDIAPRLSFRRQCVHISANEFRVSVVWRQVLQRYRRSGQAYELNQRREQHWILALPYCTEAAKLLVIDYAGVAGCGGIANERLR